MTAKKALVLVHGYLGGSPQWAEQVAAFSATYQVITPDLPGFGMNHQLKTPESITELAQFVLNELDQQQIEQCYLLGHSMGGMIVQELVSLAPQRVEKLVLYGTGPVGEMPGRFETIAESRRKMHEQGVAVSARRIAAKWFVDGEQSTAYPACADIALMADLQAGLAGLTAMEHWSGVNKLSAITVPTLVLWGDQDRSYPWALPQQLWQNIPGASLSVVAGASHAVHLEKPALFNAILDDFLA